MATFTFPVRHRPRRAAGAVCAAVGRRGAAGAACAAGAVCAVPWRVVRDSRGAVRAFENASDQTVFQVRLLVCGCETFAQSLPLTLRAGDRLDIRGDSSGWSAPIYDPTALVVVRWLTREGRELLWSAPLL